MNESIGSKQQLKIAMLGHKRIPSREGGVEIVVEELATRMTERGNTVVCFNRKGHHVAGIDFDTKIKSEYKGVILKEVFTINKRGLAAMTSSFFASIRASFGKFDVVHIHAEGPAFMCWLPKLCGKKVIVTIHGRDDIIEKTGRKASKLRLCDNIVSYPEHKYTFPSIPVLTAKPAYVMPESFTAA